MDRVLKVFFGSGVKQWASLVEGAAQV